MMSPARMTFGWLVHCATRAAYVGIVVVIGAALVHWVTGHAPDYTAAAWFTFAGAFIYQQIEWRP